MTDKHVFDRPLRVDIMSVPGEGYVARYRPISANYYLDGSGRSISEALHDLAEVIENPREREQDIVVGVI